MCGFLDYIITTCLPCCSDKKLIFDENTKLSSNTTSDTNTPAIAGDRFYELSLEDDETLSMTGHVVSLNGDTSYQTLY